MWTTKRRDVMIVGRSVSTGRDSWVEFNLPFFFFSNLMNDRGVCLIGLFHVNWSENGIF